MRRTLLLFYHILFYCSFIYSQPGNDLVRAIEKESNPSKKAILLLQQSDASKNSDPFLSFLSAKKAAEIIGNSDRHKLAEAESYMALYYNKSDKVDSVLYLTQKNIPYLNSQNDRSALLVNFYNLEGGYFMHSNRQRDALERFYNSLRIADATGDPLSKIKAVVNIGWAFMELNQFDTAISNFKTAIGLMQSNHLDIFAAVYNNTASCFGDLEQYDSAQHYVTRGIEIARKNNDLIGEANGLNILGTVYEAKQQYNEELKVLMQAKGIREKLGDPFFIVSDMATIAGLYSKTGEYQKGVDISKQAIGIAEKNNLTIKLPLIYQAMASNYEGLGDFKSATEIYKRLNTEKDSLYADASPQALAQMRTQYETEKKERQIEEQNARIAKQRIMLYGSVSVGILICLLLYALYRRYQWKQEARMKETILHQQEETTRAVIEAEEAERQRIAKDLHDSVGQMMSAAKMNLSAYESGVNFRSAEEKESFNKILELVDDSCREVRSVSHNMMPNALLKNNLAAALHEFINKLDHNRMEVHVYTEGLEERLDTDIETVLYRVIQECVNNVIKHADATNLDISVTREDNMISATIEDNGKGFDISDYENFEGIGLKNIRTRVEYLKGSIDFDSARGRGTLVALHVPV